MIHVVAGVRQMTGILQCVPHGVLLAFGNRDDVPQRINLLIGSTADSTFVRTAEQEKLRVVGLPGGDAEQIVDVAGTFDLIDARDQPGIGNFGIEPLILLWHGGDLRFRQISELKRRMPFC